MFLEFLDYNQLTWKMINFNDIIEIFPADNTYELTIIRCRDGEDFHDFQTAKKYNEIAELFKTNKLSLTILPNSLTKFDEDKPKNAKELFDKVCDIIIDFEKDKNDYHLNEEFSN